MADVGKNIRKFRTKRHMTQDDLAERLFVSRQTVSNYETGKSNPDLDTLLKIAEVLETGRVGEFVHDFQRVVRPHVGVAQGHHVAKTRIVQRFDDVSPLVADADAGQIDLFIGRDFTGFRFTVA